MITRTADVAKVDQCYKNKKQKAIEKAVAMQGQLEDDGIIDRHKKLQPARPKIHEHLVCAELKILYKYVEPDRSSNNMWCKGVVIAVQLGKEFVLNVMLASFERVMNQLPRKYY